MLAELVAQAGTPGARARRIDLPDGSLILWLPPTAAAPAGGATPAAAPTTAAPGPASAEARAAEDDRAAIVYTVSHDLRAPIRVIEGFTRIVREDYGHLLDRVGNDHLERIMGAATRMNGMIDALLALSRLSTQPLQSVEVDLGEMARQIVEELRQQAPERQVEVRIADGLSATGDPALLRIVLDNLIGNAWKYSSRREAALIEFGRARDPERGREAFFVRDNGAGFDMRFAGKLFGAFQRLHGATEFAGTGVGLASVRRILRRHGGDIRAEAAVNQGATFWFTLG
ncbi:MAG: ATP-binding protein [Sphaerotilus natans]